MRALEDRPALLELEWTRPADGLWIASVDGEFAGMIEFVDGRFTTTDRTGGLLDDFGGIRHAMNAVASQRPARR